MSLIEEARSQLDVEATLYIRSAQQSLYPTLPSPNEPLLSLSTTQGKRPAAGVAATISAMANTAAAFPASTAASAQRSAATDVKKAAKGSGDTTAAAAATTASSGPRASNPKQARARLQELVKKLQRATFVAVQASKEEAVVVADGGDRLSRRGSHAEILSRKQSSLSLANLRQASSPAVLPTLPSMTTTAPPSRSKVGPKGKQIPGRATHAAAAAAAASGAAATAPAGEKRADMRVASPHLPPHSSASLADTQRSQSFHRRHRDTERSHSAATSATSRDRSASPSSGAMAAGGNGGGAANSAAALRRLEASLMFANDCLQYASNFAEAGLMHEAQGCFLQPIAQDMANLYEPIVARCVERRPRSSARQTQQQHQQQQQQLKEMANAAATSTAADPRRRRMSKGKGLKDGQKHNGLSAAGDDAAAGHTLLSPNAPSSEAALAAEAAMEGGVRMTDTIDVFASDVPLPLALQVYKCVLRHRALATFIRFRELLQSDLYGDAAGMATSVAAVACLEELVAQQQRVLHTTTFCAAVLLRSETARILEDVAHTAAAKPVNAIVVAGGCKLVDLLAEPAAQQTRLTSLSLSTLSEEPPILLYPVEEVAAPVLLRMRLYIAVMCEQLFGYTRSTTTREVAQTCAEVRTAVFQRSLEALRTSVSMSELHLGKAGTPRSTAAETKGQQQQQQQQSNPRSKTCLPLATVEYLPWRLQEYTLLQQGYQQLEDGTAAAVTAAEHALQQVLQLVELEYLDPVPPPPTTTATLDAAVQQCASWLLVAMWHAAVAQGSSSVSTYIALSSATPTSSLTQPPAQAQAAEQGGDFAPGGDAPPMMALQMAATARTAMAAITAVVQQAVAYLVTAQWTPTHTAPPSHALGAGEGMQRRGSRRGGPNTATATAATAAGGAGSSVGGVVSDGFTAPAMNGTRLLVALWTCFAHVQQQCSLLVGRPAVADALAAAAKDTDYIEGIEDGGEETSAEGRSSGRTPGQSPAAHAPMKRSLSKSPPPPAQQQQQQQRKANGKGKPSPAGAAASSTSGGYGGDGVMGKGGEAADAVPPLELRHAHPVVAFLAALFPRMAMEVLLQLVGVVEAAGAVPQAPAYTGGREGKRGGTKAGEGGGAGGPEGTLMGRKLNESPERRSARGGRRRASSIAIAGDSVNSVFNAASGGGLGAGAGLSTAAFKLRALQGVYHGCVEALEVLLHAAAVKATESASSGTAVATTAGGAAGAHTSIVPPPPPPAASLTPFLGSATMTPPRFDNNAAAAASSTAFSPAAQSLGPLSVLTRAAVWNDAVDVLGYCDETAAEWQSFASRGGALYAAETSTPPPPQQSSTVPEARTFASVTQLPAVCFLYNPADTRCVLRHVSWTALFTSPEKESSSSGFAFSAKSLAESAVSRAVTALRTVSFASPRLAVAVRVGLSMEAWCRAQLVPPPAGKAAALPAAATTTTTTTPKTAAPVVATAGKKAATVAASTAVEAALRCVQLLRAVLLAALLHRHQQQQQPAVAHGGLKRESPLTSVLRLFEAAASALDVVEPAVAVSPPSTPAGAAVGAATAALTLSAPSLSSFPAGEVCQPGEQQPASSRAASTVQVHSEADAHLRLTAEAQTALQLSIYQRRPLRDPSGHTTVALREYYERNDAEDAQADAAGDAWSSPSASHTAPPSMSFYKASALLIEKVTSALCPASSDGNTAHNSSSNNSTTLPVTSCAALLLQPITSDAGSFLLRCSEALRAQWQHQRARRLLQDVGHDSSAVAAAAGDNMTASAVGRTTLGATGADTLAASTGPREPSLLLEEQEAREEAFYATIVWSALSFLWRSGGSGAGGAPRLDESGVAAITRRVSSGFLQLLPTSSGGEVACRIAPVALTRLLAHGAMVRRLLELSRSHLQAHVESLVRHTPGTTAVSVGHGRAYPHKTTSNATAAQLASQHRSLVHARDGVTELTHTWVAVRWQLARLKLHHADYAARHADLETLQQRHDQHRVFGRPTAKELRIQQTLENDAPLLPLIANDEEVRLKRWVKDQQHAATGTSAVGSCLLLEALVCAALVPLNQADPAAQQKLVDEAIRALSDAEKHGAGETTYRPGSGSGANNAGAASRGAVAPSAVKHTQEASAIYNAVLLWCYLADACSRCGTAEQTARVRGVLDRHLLTETPEIKRPSAPFNVPMTAPFVQKLLLQPRWAVLEDCSSTTRVAFCRALSALASRAASSSAAASASALGSLQSAYRLLLALQIQRMPDPSSAAGAAPPPLRTGPGGSEKKRTTEHPGFSGGLSDAVARHGPSSKLTLSSAQQLLAAITEYLTRSSGGASMAGTGSPAAALLLPLLVELCNVLLHLPASSPQWADAEVQLFALRVLLLFKRQQLAVLTASPSPLTSATVTGTSATAAAAAAAGMMDAFLQLLWTTFAHVWNSVFRNPNARQRRCIAAGAHTTQWARRVLEQHRRQTLQMAAGHDRDADGSGSGGGAESAATGKHPRSPRKAGGGGGTSIAADGTAAAGSVDAAAGAPAPPFDDAGGNALTFAGVAYLPESDERAHREEDGAAVGGVNDSESPERRRVSPGRPKSSSPAHPSGGSSNAVSSLPTVSLHSHMPSEFMELLEDILLHLPQLWSYLLAPPGAVPIPAVATAANRPVGADVSPGRAASPPNPSSQSATLNGAAGGGGCGEAASRMDTQCDFVHYAAMQAVQALRESQRSSAPASGSSAAASTTGERRASTHVTAGGLLCGVPPIYMDVVAALQQYSVTMASSSSNGGAVSGGGGGSAAAANGSSAQQNANSNTAGSTTAGGGGGGNNGARGGNARGAGGAVAVPAVSAACLTLIESLQRYKEDPAYAKLAVHVVRALLSLCCDEGSSGAFVSIVNGSGGGAGGGAAGGGGANAANSSGSRKKNPASGAGGGGAAAGAGGMGDAFSAGLRCNAGISASAVTTDVQCIIRAVREQAHENHRALRAFLSQVDDETHAWLVRGGYSLAGQAQQLQQQQSGGGSGQAGGANTSATPPSTADAARGSKGKTAAAGAATNASAGSAGKKGAKKGNKKGAAGRGRKSDGNEDASDDDDEATRNGDDAQHSAAGVPYSTVTRAFSFAEEQKLKQLTCAVARWRRSRAGRLLRGRYVQYNTPFLAQLHLIEAALLFMGAAVQQDVVRQRAVMHELLAFSEGAGGDAQLAGGAAVATASSSSTARGVQRDKKKPGGPPLSARSPEEAEVDDPTAVTEELLRHCAAASNLFQSVWMPVRASTAVQLAVQHLRHSPLQTRSTAASSGAGATPAATTAFGLSSSSTKKAQGGKLSPAAALVAQLLTVPLFAMAAVQLGYHDARRDVHTCVLQPTVVKVGAAASWSQRDAFAYAVPSLFSLVSPVGVKGEEAMVQQGRLQAQRQRHYERLRLLWCVEAETDTRAEAVRDELQARVRIIQQAQQVLLPTPTHTTFLKARLVSAAELLALAPERQRNADSALRVKRASGETAGALTQGRESSHAPVNGGGATPNPPSFHYSLFDGALGAPVFGTADNAASAKKGKSVKEGSDGPAAAPVSDGGRYGRDMAEAVLVQQLIALAHEVERESPQLGMQAYRTAQQLTAGRHATELLPRLVQMEEADNNCGHDAAIAYEKVLRGISDGVWLLRTARETRRQLLPLGGSLGRSGRSGDSSSSVGGGGDGPSSWKVVVDAFQRAAKSLRAAGNLQLLGECLYELGNLHCAASRIDEAERSWSDAVDCFLSTPHVLEEWHTRRAIPPPPPSTSPSSVSSGRGVAELLWVMAALTALADHAYATDAARFHDAQSLCALLVHKYWRLPAVVASGSAEDGAKGPATHHNALLPPSAYSQLDVTSMGIQVGSSAAKTSPEQRSTATAMPDTLALTVHALIRTAHILLHRRCSGDATIIAAFSDFVATVHLRDVSLAVSARLARAMAAAELGGFAVAMRHIHSVCVGTGLPQPVGGLLSEDGLPGYYSISAAVAAAIAARVVGASSSSSSSMSAGAKKPVAGTGAAAGAGGGGGGVAGGGGGSSPSPAGGPSTNNSGNGGGGGGAAAALSGAPATALPSSVISFFYLYRDHESPSTPHNTAAVRAFLLACLPGLAVDAALPTISASGRSAFAAAASVPLTGGLLASPALESLYGVCLLRNVHLSIAELLMRLGTCDPIFLFRSPSGSPLTGSSAAGGPHATTAINATTTVTSASTSAAAAGAVNAAGNTSSAAAATGVAATAASASGVSFPPLATGERPTNACTEACRYAQLLLHSLRSADIRFAISGQPSAASGLNSADDTDGAAAAAAAAVTGRATRTQGEAGSTSRSREAVNKDVVATVTSPPEAERDITERPECMACLVRLGVIRQRAILLTSEILAAQGQYSACLQLLTSIVVEFNDAQAGLPNAAAQSSSAVSGTSSSYAGRPAPSTAPSRSLRDYGMQGSRSCSRPRRRTAVASLPAPYTYVYWAYVWQLVCRCYCALRLFPQLESAAEAQGLQLCAISGDTSTNRNIFQLYRLYALGQMGRMREAAEVASDLHRSLNSTPPIESPVVRAVPAGMTDDGSVATALQWWVMQHPGDGPSLWSPALSSQRVVAQLTAVAVAKRCLLPWRAVSTSPPMLVLESPNAESVVPPCPLSGCVKTRDAWRLHAAMIRCAFEMKWRPPPSAPSALPSSSSVERVAADRGSGGGMTGSSHQRSPQPPPPRLLSSTRGAGAINGRSAASPVPPADTQAAAAAAVSFESATDSASWLLRESVEGLCPQYTAQAHPIRCLESRIVSISIRNMDVAQKLQARQQEAVAATVEFAVDDGEEAPAEAIAEVCRAPPSLTSRDAALAALPLPVRDICTELLHTLQLFVQYPVQQHMSIRVLLISIAGVLSVYIRSVRLRCRSGRIDAALAEAEALLPQYAAIVAACTLLAGLVSDMERRIRTGADSFRGYFTDPRLSSSDGCDTLALLLESQWPESLSVAVRQTHATVGQLQAATGVTHDRNSNNNNINGASPATAHPFYTLPAVQQQIFGIAVPTAAAAPGTAAGGASGAGSGSGGSRGGSAGSRDAGGASKRSASQPSAGGTGAGTAGTVGILSPTAGPAASPLLSVPALALTFAALSDEAAAVQALTPVGGALEHDVVMQLLTAHLQALSPPVNCTYLCYRDDVRQQLLEAVGATLGQQQQLQQQQQQSRTGQRRTSNTATKRPGGPTGASGNAGGATQSTGAASGAPAVAFSDADVWKALVPPVMLASVPADLFSALGPDTLGAPLYNSVAAAGLEMLVYNLSSAAAGAAGKKRGTAETGGAETTTSMWRLHLAVSPLNDPAVVEAPFMSSNTSTILSTADAAVLLPPAHLVAAVNGGGTDGAGAGGGGGVSLSSAAFMAGGGGNASTSSASASAAASARGRGMGRPSGAAAFSNTNAAAAAAAAGIVSPQRRSSGQESSVMGNGGCVWPPLSAAACLVPSTNWAYLDQIQQEGLSMSPSGVEEGGGATAAPAAVKATSPAAGNRAHAAVKATRGINASTAGGSAPLSTAAAAAASECGKSSSTIGDHMTQAHSPLRWNCVSLELSIATMSGIQRHLRRLLRCMHRAKEVDCTMLSAAPVEVGRTASDGAALSKASTTALAAAKGEAADGGRGAATRTALAAAVSRAQQTLRAHLAAAGVAAAAAGTNAAGGGGGVGGSGAGGSSVSASALSASAAGGSVVSGGGPGTAAGGSGAAAASGTAASARKAAARLAGAASVAQRSSGAPVDSALGAAAATSAHEGGAASDDLTEELRERQTAQRERLRQQCAEELEEAQRSLLRELLEAVVSAAAAGTGEAAAVMDEARVEMDVQRLLPRCPLSASIVDFLCDWLGGVTVAGSEAEGSDGADGASGNPRPLSVSKSNSGTTALRFYNAGLHAWMQRIAQYVVEQQQQQQQRPSRQSGLR